MTTQPPQKEIDLLVEFLNQKKLDTVIQKAEQLIIEYPDAYVIWSILGASAAQTGDRIKARRAFEKAIQINPDYFQSHNNFGTFLKNEGDLKGAVTAFQKTVLLQPQNANAQNNLGVALKGLGDLDAALTAFKAAVLLKSNYADAYFNMAIILKSQSKLAEAIMAQKKAISLMPDYQKNQDLPLKVISIQKVEPAKFTYSALASPQDTKLTSLAFPKNGYSLEWAAKADRLPVNYHIKNAKVLGQSNIILNNKSKFALENIAFNKVNPDKILDLNEEPFFDFTKQEYYFTEEISIRHAVFIGSHWNFGHWIFNHLARIFFMDEGAWKTSKLIVSASLNNNYADTLVEIGVPTENIIRVKTSQILKVENLLIPQMPWISFEGVLFAAQDLFPWLRKKFNVNVNTGGNKDKKVFITRANAKHRRVTNEKELFEIAQDFGFILTDIGSLSIPEQLFLGRETSHIISPMGANSSFFLFARDNAKMLELAFPMRRMNVMGAFAQASSIKYRQIIGREQVNNSIHALDYDYFIDPLKFREELQLLLS